MSMDVQTPQIVLPGNIYDMAITSLLRLAYTGIDSSRVYRYNNTGILEKWAILRYKSIGKCTAAMEDLSEYDMSIVPFVLCMPKICPIDDLNTFPSDFVRMHLQVWDSGA
jgi:hypothetical protein